MTAATARAIRLYVVAPLVATAGTAAAIALTVGMWVRLYEALALDVVPHMASVAY
ncbi:hypothetical protein [Chthonobacter rhizosphaerae]|uniref:hypothetical protein n=1 Tax=Chthonobacter rhizosphaerae TaxID=2735553 RepID=UPI0015EE5740|nr:hypothetical protein [Chthonobacter rhizosphaerae]